VAAVPLFFLPFDSNCTDHLRSVRAAPLQFDEGEFCEEKNFVLVTESIRAQCCHCWQRKSGLMEVSDSDAVSAGTSSD
jgi:hypothetical protein